MEEDRGKKIKFYIIICLSILFIISFYFRFIHAKMNNNNESVKNSLPSVSLPQLLIPKLDPSKLKETEDLKTVLNNNIQSAIRDIFFPPTLLSDSDTAEPVEEIPEPEIPVNDPEMKLKGTIVGKNSSIAIIDNQFLREGDQIGEYIVKNIGKKDVLLISDSRSIKLEILKNE